jgi:diguanylate cyclase
MSENVVQRAGRIFSAMPFGIRLGAAVAVTLLALGTAWLVYATGGVRFAYLHLMYVPIGLGALAFGVPGGMTAGIVCGLLIGPLMPIDTATGEMQQTINWTYRLAFFTLNGALVGAGAQLLRRHLRELEWLHEHHAETGLLNVSGLLKELDSLMRSKNGEEKLVIFVTQLNNFLEIQNTFGPAFGTRLLLQVVKRMREVVPSGSLLALLQADRLATVVVSEKAAQETGNRVEAAAKESYMLDGVPIHVDTSIGVAHFPNHARTPEELLQKASIAMHWATTSKSSISLYDSGNDRTSRDNLILLGALPDAIANSELRIWHQAKLALATGEIAGTEALLRWQHPQRGLVLPGSFVPQLEETTLINPVTQWVIAAAFGDAADWRAKGYRLRVSVNLSVRNLRGGMLLDVLEENLRRHGLDPAEIELEITESAVMSDPDYCIHLIALLRERGYRVSIDDFGVGQSSLSYLKKLRVSDLKIDQEFVKNLPTDANNQKIVRSILHLAASMGLATIAEGVEDDQTAALLREWGCDYAQGYGIHRPAPFADLLRFIDGRNPEVHKVDRAL